jgi:hypothetical protein
MPPQFTKLELVSHGEHLIQVANQLERAESQTQRELRAQGLMATLKALSSAAGGEFAAAVGEFARAARSLVGRAFGAGEWVRFVRAVREGGSVLSLAAREAESGVAQRIQAVTRELLQLGSSAAAPAPAPAAASPTLVEVRPERVPRQPTAVEADLSDSSLAASYLRYEQLLAAVGSHPAPPLEELLGRAVEAPAPGAAEEAVVPITELCYSGAAAFERALSLRAEVEALLSKIPRDGSGQALNDLIREIFDLVELGVGRKG